MAELLIGFYVTDCASCGMLFAFPAKWEDRLRQSKETFYCPHGHMMSFGGKTPTQEIREANAARIAADTRRAQAEIEAKKLKAKLKRVTKKLAGVR